MTVKVGVIGGGQLARMMIPPAVEMGIDLRVLAEAEDSSARLAASMVGDYRDLETVMSFAKQVDVVTFDHEHVPVTILESLEEEGIVVRPGPAALVHAQDKAVMRQRLGELGSPGPRWALANNSGEFQAFIDAGDSQAVIAKTPRGGYDGNGVRVVADPVELGDWLEVGPVLLEEKVDFQIEVAQLVARRPSGEVAVWPLVQTVQKNGMCAEVIAPAPLDSSDHAAARDIAVAIAEGLGVIGVLAVEMFALDDGSLVVNELAMRPHNSGHVFTELSVTSQFEQHLRAVVDWPLGDTSLVAPAGVMVNVLGGVNRASIPKALAEESAIKVHDYGKTARPGRKSGHVCVIGENATNLRATGARAATILSGTTSSD